MTRSELRAAIQAALDAASAIVTAVDAGEVATAQDFETAVGDVRESLAELIPLVDAEWGADSIATVLALQAVGARLLDLRVLITDGRDQLVESVQRLASWPELAVSWYADVDRWTELAGLNRAVPHPGFIRPGTQVVRYAE